MGLIKAITGATGGVLADQWKEYFYCEAIPANILAINGQKSVGKRSGGLCGRRMEMLLRRNCYRQILP